MLTAIVIVIALALAIFGPSPCPTWLQVVVGIGAAYLLLTLIAEWWQWFAHRDRVVLEALSEAEPEDQPQTATELRSYTIGLFWMGVFIWALRAGAISLLIWYMLK